MLVLARSARCSCCAPFAAVLVSLLSLSLLRCWCVQNWLGFGGTPLDIDIVLSNQDQLKQVLGKNEQNEVEPLFLLTANDNVAGTVQIKYKGKKVEHLGIKIELIGQIEFMHDAGNPHEFTSLVRDLEDAGEITADKIFNFEFNNVEKQYETYNGNNVRLRYFLRCRVSRQYASNITKTLDLAVQNLAQEPEVNNSIKMEVGIEDWSVMTHTQKKKPLRQTGETRARNECRCCMRLTWLCFCFPPRSPGPSHLSSSPFPRQLAHRVRVQQV